MIRWVHDQLRDRILRGCGVDPPVPLEELYRTRWSREFERLMRNRLVMGFYRYGEPPFGPGPAYDNVGCALVKLRDYMQVGSLEILVDVANLCLCEFLTRSSNPAARWWSRDDDGHARRIVGGCVVELDEEDRQLVILALATLAVVSPVFDDALGRIAARIDDVVAGKPVMFGQFKSLRRGRRDE